MNASLWQGTNDHQLPRAAFVWHRSILLSNMCSNMCRMVRPYACETLWITSMKRMVCLRRPGTSSAAWVSLRWYAPPSWNPECCDRNESQSYNLLVTALHWSLDSCKSGFQVFENELNTDECFSLARYEWSSTSTGNLCFFRGEAPMYYVEQHVQQHV